MSILPGQIPAFTEPFGDDTTGSEVMIRKNWWLFLYNLGVHSPGGAVQEITATASPFTWTSPGDGSIIVSGGTVTDIEIGRSGRFFTTGSTSGQFESHFGDQVRITYSAAPTINYFPNF